MTLNHFPKNVFNNLNYRTLDKLFCLSLERCKIFETKVADKKGADNSFLLLTGLGVTIFRHKPNGRCLHLENVS